MKRVSRTKYTEDHNFGGYSSLSFCNFDSAPSPPPAPDYTGAAEATAAGNLEAVKYQTEANRINQVTPWANLSYANNRTFDQAGYDAALAAYNQGNQQGTWVPGTDATTRWEGGGEGGNMVTVPGTTGHWEGATSNGADAPDKDKFYHDGWTQTTTLAPEVQAALDAQMAIQKGKSEQAQSMLQSVKDSYSTPFQAPQLSSYLGGVNSVNQGSVGQAGQFSSNANQDTQFNNTTPGLNTDYSRFTSGTPGLSTDAQAYLGGVNGVNQNAPQFDPSQADLYAKKAYEAQMALLRPGLDDQQQKLQNGLALQGLNVGTEANNNAQSAYSMARAAQENALAASSYLSGAQTAQGNYGAQLAGFNAGNQAQNQAFGQGMDVFGANNAARTQGLNNELSVFGANQGATNAENQARAAQYAQQLQAYQAQNAAKAQQYSQDLGSYGANLQGLSTNSQLQAAQNAAQQQAYQQAVGNYGMDWQQAQTMRNMPLNELNALLTGQQVQNPQFNSYALQGQTQGADYNSATANQAQWDQGIWNSQAAAAAGNNNSTAGMIGTAASLIAMY